MKDMTGAQKYVGGRRAVEPAAEQAKRDIAAVAAAGMKREPKYSQEYRYAGKSNG